MKAYSLGLYAFLLLIHFTLKDHFFPISIIFYATPLVLIAGFGFLILWLYRKNKTIFILLIIIQCYLIFNWLNYYYYLEIVKTPSAESKAILFWNIGKNKNGFPNDIILEKTKSENIDILTFVETDSISHKDILNLKKDYKQYTFKKLKGNMLIGTKRKIISIIFKAEEQSYKFNHIILENENKKTAILIVDIYASPFYSKEKALKAIIEYANTNAIDIIVGDFNTPYESIHFKNYHNTFTSFHSYGNGFTATWPHSLPLLELDQIWLNKKKKPLKLQKFHNSFSDHKLLIAKYQLK